MPKQIEVKDMAAPNSESALIAEQLRRAFEGDAWHGPALLELLQDVNAATAAARPLPEVHSIWELVLHVAAWDGAACRRLGGEKVQLTGAANFPVVPKPTGAAWRKAVAHAKRTHDVLVKTVKSLPEARLRARVPGKKYDFYFMLHGVAQHELYHAGQIAILKKAARIE
ncbi:MAG: DinB family protein [Candidatus Sulfotelmatobacter sp.]